MPNKYLEDRKKAGPFLPKWTQLKGRHKVLANASIFKPDVGPIISRYDGSVKEYDDLLKDEAGLKDMIADLLKQGSDSTDEIKQLTDQITQVTKTAQDQMAKGAAALLKCANGATVDPADVVSALNDIAGAAEDFVNKRKQLWTDIDGTAYNNLMRYKKCRDDYKKKADAVTAGMKKLEDTTYKAAQDIGGAFVDYMNIAEDVDHDEVIKDIKALVAKF